uniref:Uncharacterized protein n=1 Tax=Ciona savignyi TaxID=51511 RepID=H2YT98_CIOSA
MTELYSRFPEQSAIKSQKRKVHFKESEAIISADKRLESPPRHGEGDTVITNTINITLLSENISHSIHPSGKTLGFQNDKFAVQSDPEHNIPSQNNKIEENVRLQLLKDILELPIKIESLPTAEKVLRHRKRYIDLSNKGLDSIPEELYEFVETEELHLEQNELRSLPPEISCLTNLRILYADRNRLEDVSSNISHLPNLTSLDLSSNPSLILPVSALLQLAYLTHLRLYNINLNEFPADFCRTMLHLRLLGFSNNHVKQLPPEMNRLRKLEELHVENNQLTEFPLCICSLT